jgi:GT2 family glycosyltransferase
MGLGDRMHKINASILVGIVTRNRAELLPKAIRSALAQDAVDMAVAVLDDGSTDPTPNLCGQFEKVHWTRWDDNLGLIEGRNYLMRSAAADYFVSLDDDAWFLNGDEISIAAQFLDQNPTVGAIALDILSPDRNQRVDRGAPHPVSMFIGCGHMLRLSVARLVGYYERSVASYGGEEKDFCLRLIDAGYETVLLPGVHVWHEKTNVERQARGQHRSGVCNDLTMALRRTPAWLLPMALLSKFLRHLFFSLTHQLTKPFLGGVGLFLRSIPKIWASRKPVKTSTLRTFMRLRPQ